MAVPDVTRVLLVCLGNICRSPTAEGVLRKKLHQAGLGDRVEVDSAGTAGWHEGKAPDPRSQAAALARGYDLSGLRARQATAEDFRRFDFVFAMDSNNLQDLRPLRPADGRAELSLFLSNIADAPRLDVPDPYYGGEEGFEQVLDLCEQAADGLIRRLQSGGVHD